MITIVTWLWKTTGWRSYDHRHVNAFARMIKANVTIPYRLVCVTDDPEGIECETIPLWSGPVIDTGNKPNCYKRLRAFSAGAKSWFGERFISFDLDCIIVNNIDKILLRPEEFIMLKGYATQYNGSLWMMNTGCRNEIWKDFTIDSPEEIKRFSANTGIKFVGSDQAWISYKLLNSNEAVFNQDDGIYQYVKLDDELETYEKYAKILFFAGPIKPWSKEFMMDSPMLHSLYRSYYGW